MWFSLIVLTLGSFVIAYIASYAKEDERTIPFILMFLLVIVYGSLVFKSAQGVWPITAWLHRPKYEKISLEGGKTFQSVANGRPVYVVNSGSLPIEICNKGGDIRIHNDGNEPVEFQIGR